MVMDRLDQMMTVAEEADTGEDMGEETIESASLKPTSAEVNAASKLASLYRTDTGEEIRIPKLYVEAALKKRFNDRERPELLSKPVFSRTRTKPHVLGQHKGLLHPSWPERALYDQWGLPVCRSEHLASPQEVLNHMAKRHQAEWKHIQSHKAELEKEDEKLRTIKMQEAQLVALQGLGRGTATPSTASPKRRKRKATP